VKKNNIKKGLFTALLLASPFVTAGNQYPAADFEPKVLFQDSEYQHESSSAGNSNASFGEKAKADSNYPAATYKPEVVYHDTEYKHNKGAANNNSIPLAVWSEAADSAAVEASSATESESSSSPLIAIVILAIAAFLFTKKSAGKKTLANGPSSDGLTGVAKYLQSKTPKLSGVAKYLEANQPTPKSGVAKYVAKRVVEAKKAAAEKTTGVEKYMRNQNRG